MKATGSRGFTLVEVCAAMVLLVMAISLAMAGYLFSIKNISQGDIQNELDIDVQLAMERLKKDLRLSSLDNMFYHPLGPGPYQAISFPLAYDSDGDGVLERETVDGVSKIRWDETVIYHIRPTSPEQLVKTVFRPRDNSLTDAQRQAQLEAVVRDGHGDDTHNGQNASSHVIFQNLLKWSISPKAGRFDAYSPNLTRSKTSLGYILLDPGTHDFTFKAIGKNDAGSGFKIGIDQLMVSPSYSAREAEAQLPPKTQSGATAASEYMQVGSWKGNHQLLFPATQAGASFTLALANDRWEDTNFGGIGYLAEDTCIRFDQALSPKNFVVQLDGMDKTWEAAAQTGSPAGLDSPGGRMRNWAVRTLHKGSDLAENGGWLALNGRKCKVAFAASATNHFALYNAYIGESASSTNLTLNYLDPAQAKPIRFGGNTAAGIAAGSQPVASDWIDLEIDRTKNYVVAYSIFDHSSLGAPKHWTDNRVSASDPSAWTTWVAEGAGGAILNHRDWDGQGFATYPTNLVIGVESLHVSYPGSGTYTSDIFDTCLANPRYGDIAWNAEIPVGTTLAFKVRTGNQPDLSDAPDWSAIEAFATPRAISAPYRRYVQYQALMGSDATGELTPRLKDVAIDWAGERKLVNIGGIFTKGPDYGIFEISVNGQPLRSALIVDLEIFKDTAAMNRQPVRLTSSLKIELTPRNSSL